MAYIGRQLSGLTLKQRAEITMQIESDWLLHHTRGGVRRTNVEMYKEISAKKLGGAPQDNQVKNSCQIFLMGPSRPSLITGFPSL
jgi:hypothetical protein